MIETAKQKAAKVASAAKDKVGFEFPRLFSCLCLFLQMKDNINTRIKFDIRLAAPCIIAPRSSCSDERLEANLGRIVLTNRFTHKESPSSSYKVLVDSLEVNLTRLELTRYNSATLFFASAATSLFRLGEAILRALMLRSSVQWSSVSLFTGVCRLVTKAFP